MNFLTRALRQPTGAPSALFTALLCLLLAHPTLAQIGAKALFSATREQVYQIRVIDLASGDKFSIGSGFRVSGDGRIATNFHVVSSYVHEPEKFRLESVDHLGNTLPLSLLAIDVVRDLALVSDATTTASFLTLATQELSNGDRIYSMGNPLDLGMTIIEGTYNGLVEHSRYRNILFSGSLNAGMSGGPALNANGEVIGINVAKGGEQISFVVPVERLRALLEKSTTPTPGTGFSAEITSALLADQQRFYEAMLAESHTRKRLGDLEIAGELSPSLRCWGHSVDEPDMRYEAAHQHCTSEDQIYVSDDLYVGELRYDVESLSTTELNRFQFYNLLEERFEHRNFYNTDDTEAVTAFSCHDDAVALNSGRWKLSSCFRAYTSLPGLYDASLVMVSLDYPQKAAVIKIAASGISKDNALKLLRAVAEAAAWKP
ncbi:MAG: serine protease [Halioglobus sp.]